MGIAARAVRPFRSLHNRNIRIYFVGLLVTQTGFWAQLIGETWLVAELTDTNGVALGLVTACNFLPMLLGGAWAGVLADRMDKRRLIFGTQTALGALALVLAVLTVTDVVEVWMVFVLALLSGCAGALDNPARRSFLYELVDRDELATTVSLASTVMSTARVLGPALAGLLIQRVGISATFFFHSASFLGLVFALTRLDKAQLRPTPRLARAKGQLREGLRYAMTNAERRLPLVMMAVIGTLSYEFQVTIPLLSRETFGGNAGTYGFLFALLSVGSLGGALVTASRETATRGYLVGSALALGAAMVLMAAAPSLLVLMVVLPFVGAAGTAFVTTSGTVLQLSADPTMQGRMVALHAVVFLGSTPIGAPIVGWLGGTLGPRWAVAIGGAAAILTAVVAGSTAPSRAQPAAVAPDLVPIPVVPIPIVPIPIVEER